MAQATSGNTVKVHYTGKLTDGMEFDSSRGRDPLEFKIGSGSVLPGFEEIVVGMEPGDKKTGTVACADAYGTYDDSRVLEIDRKTLPPDVKIEVGQVLEMRRDDGMVIPVKVAGFTDDTVKLDANHPLTDQDLVFEIELLEIV